MIILGMTHLVQPMVWPTTSICASSNSCVFVVGCWSHVRSQHRDYHCWSRHCRLHLHLHTHHRAHGTPASSPPLRHRHGHLFLHPRSLFLPAEQDYCWRQQHQLAADTRCLLLPRPLLHRLRSHPVDVHRWNDPATDCRLRILYLLHVQLVWSLHCYQVLQWSHRACWLLRSFLDLCYYFSPIGDICFLFSSGNKR